MATYWPSPLLCTSLPLGCLTRLLSRLSGCMLLLMIESEHAIGLRSLEPTRTWTHMSVPLASRLAICRVPAQNPAVALPSRGLGSGSMGQNAAVEYRWLRSRAALGGLHRPFWVTSPTRRPREPQAPCHASPPHRAATLGRVATVGRGARPEARIWRLIWISARLGQRDLR